MRKRTAFTHKISVSGLGFAHTCIVNRVLTNSSGYVHKVELTPAHAPAINDAGIGSFGCSPGAGDNFLFTVSYAKSCRHRSQLQARLDTLNWDVALNMQKLHDLFILL
jgi:hypothetical protein